jgi:hypothetical protein
MSSCNLPFYGLQQIAELAEQPTREQAAREVKSVVHTMALEDQKPVQLTELAGSN